MSGWEKNAGYWGCSPRAPLGARGTPSPEMSLRYLGEENKSTGEAAAGAIYSPSPQFFKTRLSFTNIYLVTKCKVVLYTGHHTSCPRQPVCPVLPSAGSVATPCPPYLYLGLRGRASQPDVHMKQGWGWVGQGGEGNGGLGREVVQDRCSSLCSSAEPPAPGWDLQEGLL